jgi:hypothetical protein
MGETKLSPQKTRLYPIVTPQEKDILYSIRPKGPKTLDFTLHLQPNIFRLIINCLLVLFSTMLSDN